ncbi:MAG: RNA-directed DNA polymerase [Actinomycetota bacterium]
MAVLSPRDEAAWHRLGGRVAPVIEQRLQPGVLANRSTESATAWSLAPVPASIRLANRVAAGVAGRSSLLLRTDVASFYGSVTPPVLAECLRSSGADPVDARLSADMLEEWGSEGYEGLPIGPPASAVMANAVLRPVDEALSPTPILRWVDDYLIGLPSAGGMLVVLDRIDEALGRVGLRRSERKTSVVEGPTALRWPGDDGSSA